MIPNATASQSQVWKEQVAHCQRRKGQQRGEPNKKTILNSVSFGPEGLSGLLGGRRGFGGRSGRKKERATERTEQKKVSSYIFERKERRREGGSMAGDFG